MPALTIRRSSPVTRSPRVRQVEGMFDLAPSDVSGQQWVVDLTLPDAWHVGVIVGPSGAGKTTVARELFGDRVVAGHDWPPDKSLLDGFPAGMGIRDITGLLSSVGFSSPPAWLRPFGVLSNGQAFRVSLARTLAETPPGQIAVVDEFTSVVDRVAARVGSAAIAKAVRHRLQRFVAVTCHYDVLDWLEPDWVYEPHTGRLVVDPRPPATVPTATDPASPDPASPDTPEPAAADAARGSLRRLDGGVGRYARPAVALEIVRVDRSAWDRFAPHHYLSQDLHRSAACYVALLDGEPAAFVATLPFPHARRPGYRESRVVCLPDYQGVGVGNATSAAVASLYVAKGVPYFSSTSHPGMIAHRCRSPLWRMHRRPELQHGHAGKGGNGMRASTATDRLTAGFEYVGPARVAAARAFGLLTGERAGPAAASRRTAPPRRTARAGPRPRRA